MCNPSKPRIRMPRLYRRHTEILGVTRNEHGHIKELKIATAFLQGSTKLPGCGQLTYICPFCRTPHYHNSDGPHFGTRNGLRIPKCHSPEFGVHEPSLYKQMAPSGWFFDLVEVADYQRAGSFPQKIKYWLSQSAGMRNSPAEKTK